MNIPKRFKSNAGVTLIELLIVILIVVILSVTMLPLLKPFVTKAKYAAEGVPVIGNIRTKVELYRVEHGHLPGVYLDNGKPLTPYSGTDVDGNAVNFYASSLTTAGDGSALIHSCFLDTNSTGTAAGNYVNNISDGPGTNTGDEKVNTGSYEWDFHVWRSLDVDYADLTGKRLNPDNVQYVCMGGSGDSYLYAIGVFGDGGKIEAGCGYAVMEFSDVANKVKFVATFERYKPYNDSQLNFKSYSAGTGAGLGGADSVDSSSDKEDFTMCYLPNFETLIEGGSSGLGDEIEVMRKAGWSVDVPSDKLLN